MARVALRGYCQVRSGDKGDTLDLTVFAPNDGFYRALEEQLTPAAVLEHFRGLARGPAEVYPLPRVRGIKIVLRNALGGGGPASLRLDAQGKSLAAAMLRMTVEVPDEVLAATPFMRPPRAVLQAPGE
ncbi:AtuA-related protein [Thermaerobacter subterraneus]|uniref:AtuA-like ferredoxin-fold domain-containing protein n=1 Tax=Thermaerobacter subterraneus DSM 13965 TaxID=867903 RepID=K6PQP6_9FIRM|nr:hypothetical protein [Thermaerobacter subterraneus]EKP95267.1 hypothetical protein ThesuDRAFT_01011 [Thermaerobacter subterraneus DSM 13965]